MEENNNIAQMLALLHELQGIDFVRQLRLITERREFSPLSTDPEIFIVGGETSGDYAPLLNAARKAVELGNRVFILPNPKGIRTADYIFVNKGVYKLYDLKTIIGKGSAGMRLSDSIGQTNRVLLNVRSNYDGRVLALDIRSYFEKNPLALEVLVYRGRKSLSVTRYQAIKPLFVKEFRKRYEK